MSLNYDDKNDAHKQSNYDWWKKNHNFITDVEIDLSKLGVKPKVIKRLHDGIAYSFKNKLTFALYSKRPISVVVFNTSNLQSSQNSVVNKYTSLKQMLNMVKLVLLTHHNIFIEPPEGIDNKKLISC